MACACLWEYRIPHTSNETHPIHLLSLCALVAVQDLRHQWGFHLEVTNEHRLQRVIHHACHQPATQHLCRLLGEGFRQPAQPPWCSKRLSLSPAVLTKNLLSSLFVVSSLAPLQSLVPFRSHPWDLEKFVIFPVVSDRITEITAFSACSTSSCVPLWVQLL